jgi:hypothetical protein
LTLSLSNAVGAPIVFGQGQGTIRNDDPYKTLLYFNSEPGEYIGQGQQFTLALGDGIFSTDRPAGGVHVGFDGATSWDLHFVPPLGVPLAPGVYVGASWPFPPPASPGLSVSGDGRACFKTTGRFTVLEAEYGPGGEVVRFAADYEQHCGAWNPGLFGSVRINSTVPVGRRLTVAGASVVEGDTGTRNLSFPFWLSEPSSAPVTVNFATSDGTAVQGSDYAGFSGSIVVPAGETDAVVAVSVFGDTVAEADETFHLSLTSPGGPPIALAGDAVGTILDDDPLPQLAVSDASVTEGNPGSPSEAVFVVSLNAASGQAVSVAYATEHGTATVDVDFTYTSGTLEIAAGTTFRTVSVPIVPDLRGEGDETFVLRLFSPSHATVSDGVATATIVDDDPDTPLGLHTVTPCRLLDTRMAGPVLGANQERTFAAGGVCGIPLTAAAVIVNVTSVSPTDRGDLRLYAAGTAAPSTSVLNFGSGQTRAGNATVILGSAAALTARCDMPIGSTGGTHLVVDVFGYFE